MPAISLCDTTLRDGSHAKRHQFTVDEVRRVAAGLESAGAAMVEVSHGDGLGGSSLTYGLSGTDEIALIEAARAELQRAKVAVLLIPGIGTKEDLQRAGDAGAEAVRVATHCTEADVSPSHLTLARQLGLDAIGFLMMAHMASPERLAEQARIMADAGAQVVYVTDSAGALVPDAVRSRVGALRAALPEEVGVGFHGHQNLGLAVGNSVAAVEAGATWIDGCLCGLGAGAGNAPTELLAAALERSGWDTGVDPLVALDVAEELVRPLMLRPLVIDRSSALLGYAGVYSSFLLHARRASERFGVSEKEILLEMGRRQAVGGQEDLIIDVAAGLAARQGVAA